MKPLPLRSALLSWSEQHSQFTMFDICFVFSTLKNQMTRSASACSFPAISSSTSQSVLAALAPSPVSVPVCSPAIQQPLTNDRHPGERHQPSVSPPLGLDFHGWEPRDAHPLSIHNQRHHWQESRANYRTAAWLTDVKKPFCSTLKDYLSRFTEKLQIVVNAEQSRKCGCFSDERGSLFL